MDYFPIIGILNQLIKSLLTNNLKTEAKQVVFWVEVFVTFLFFHRYNLKAIFHFIIH